jgi:regulator of nucleoside diphosphate kinase
MSNLIISKLDYARISKVINEAKFNRSISSVEEEKLVNELNSATIVEPDAVPSDVVTMNSIVKLSFLNNNKQV